MSCRTLVPGFGGTYAGRQDKVTSEHSSHRLFWKRVHPKRILLVQPWCTIALESNTSNRFPWTCCMEIVVSCVRFRSVASCLSQYWENTLELSLSCFSSIQFRSVGLIATYGSTSISPRKVIVVMYTLGPKAIKTNAWLMRMVLEGCLCLISRCRQAYQPEPP